MDFKEIEKELEIKFDKIAMFYHPFGIQIQLEPSDFANLINCSEVEFIENYFDLSEGELERFLEYDNWVKDGAKCLGLTKKGFQCKSKGNGINAFYDLDQNPKKIANCRKFDEFFYCDFHRPKEDTIKKY